ncbi:hypothetical protein C2E23DRAFT_835112 [Lenzites betulinus]|nr:hypothetical protein C2E23DRAFT_835112 [Lenzites betulinus]
MNRMNASAPVVAIPPQAQFQAPIVDTVGPSASAGARAAMSPGEDARSRTKNAASAGTRAPSGSVRTTRRCCETSCTNALAPQWKWRRCPACRVAAQTRTVTATCATCSSVTSIKLSSINAGESPQCTMCRQRELAARAGIILPTALPIPIMGPPQAHPPGNRTRTIAPLSVSVTSAAPRRARSVLEEVAPFIHPEHLRVIRARGDAPLDLLAKSPPAPRGYIPPDHSAAEFAPHYGPRGEILAVTPAALSRSDARVVAQPFMPPHSDRSSAESIVVPRADDTKVAFQRRRRSNGTPVEAGPSKPLRTLLPSPDPSSFLGVTATIQDTVPRKKRKRTIALTPADPPPERVCVSLSCGKPLSPKSRGQFCSDCGFLLWRKQFRARVAGLSASVPSDAPKSEKGKEKESAVKQEHDSAPSRVEGWTATDELALVEVQAPSKPAAPDQTPVPTLAPAPVSTSEPAESEPKPRRLTLKLPARPAVAASTVPEAAPKAPSPGISRDDNMDEDSDDDDDEPLSVAIVRKRSSTSLGVRTHSTTPVAVDPSTTRESGSVTPDEEKSSTTPAFPTLLIPAVSRTPTPAELATTVSLPSHINTPPIEGSEEPIPPVPPRPRIRLILRPPRPPSPASVESESDEESSDEPSSSSSRSSSPEPLTLDDLTRRASLLWESDESDLTPLEDLTDMGESEITESESEDEIPPPTPKDIDLIPQAPWPLSPKPPPPVKHRGICRVGRCMNLLVQNTRMRFCSICSTRKRIIQRRHQHAGTIYLDKVDESMAFKLPADGDMTSFRKCSRRQCKRLIPPEADYRWRSCPPCRVDARNRTRLRRLVPVDFPEDDDSDDEEDIPLAQVVSARRRAKHKSSLPESTSPPGDPDKLLPVVPMYQHFAALLASLHTRFREFAVAQAHYIRFKAQQNDIQPDTHRNPHVFRFDGEYSVVADPSGGLVDAVVACVLRNVQAALGLQFTPVGVKDGAESSVIAILRCMYGAQIPLPRKGRPEVSPKEAAVKEDVKASVDDNAASDDMFSVKMVGELQIWVAWDRRHRYFPGQRIMVRFRLVG